MKNFPKLQIGLLAMFFVVFNSIFITEPQPISAEIQTNLTIEKIIYTSMGATNLELFSMDSDGNHAKQLTFHSSGGETAESSVSPDGKKVVFGYGWPSGSQQIRVMDSFTEDHDNNASQLIYSSQSAVAPRWSPDGSKIVLASGINAAQDLFLINSDGSGSIANLTNWCGGDNSPDFSPDGSLIAWTSNGGNCEVDARDKTIYLMNSDGSQIRQLLNNGNPINAGSVRWSPDGTKLMFNRMSVNGLDWSVYTINSNGTNPQLIIDHAIGASWSPDGEKIVINQSSKILVIKSDGTGSPQIINDNGYATDWHVMLAKAHGARATWVWNATNILHNYQLPNKVNARTEFFNFLQSPHGDPGHKISTVFIQIPDHYFTDKDLIKLVRDFLDEADKQGIEVHYLSPGVESKTWVTDMPNVNYARGLIKHVLEFNKGTTEISKTFKGIHLDIEPAENKDWGTKKVEYWKNYKTLLDFISTDIKEYNKTHPAIIFGVDTVTYTPWYESNDIDGNGREDYKEIFDYVDVITTMDYSDHAYDRNIDFLFGSFGLITRNNNVILEAQRIGKKVIVGVETDNIMDGRNPNFREWQTFYEQGLNIMENELNLVDSEFQANPAYGGLAIHFYSDELNVYAYKCLKYLGGCDGDNSPSTNHSILINMGETITQSALIPPFYYMSRFIINWTGSTVDTSLVAPSGRIITPNDADTDPNVIHYKGDDYEMYYLLSPESGNWSIQLYGADIPAGGEEVSIEVFSSNETPRLYLPMLIK